MTDQKGVAEKLLQTGAVQLSPHKPYTWASGWKSPIYCDNRKILSFPYIREYIKSEMCNVIFDQYPDADLIAGVATAGIAWGAMVADQLKLPFIYVRPKPKEHGLGNQIEGAFEKGQKTVVVEETGLRNIQLGELAGITHHHYVEQGKHIDKETYWYAMKVSGKQNLIPQTDEDILELRWVAENELEYYLSNTYPNIVQIIEKYFDDHNQVN